MSTPLENLNAIGKMKCRFVVDSKVADKTEQSIYTFRATRPILGHVTYMVGEIFFAEVNILEADAMVAISHNEKMDARVVFFASAIMLSVMSAIDTDLTDRYFAMAPSDRLNATTGRVAKLQDKSHDDLTLLQDRALTIMIERAATGQ